jgi:hypothetical protein
VVRFPAGAVDFSLFSVHTLPGTRLSPYSLGTRGCSPAVNLPVPELTTHPHLVLEVENERSYNSTSTYALMPCTSFLLLRSSPRNSVWESLVCIIFDSKSCRFMIGWWMCRKIVRYLLCRLTVLVGDLLMALWRSALAS